MVLYLGIRKGLHVFKVKHDFDNYRVTFNKDGEFDNMGLFHAPKREYFETEEEYIHAESVDADVFFDVVQKVEEYVKRVGLFTLKND